MSLDAGVRLRGRDESSAIGLCGLAGDEQMEVVGHEAVRKYCEALLVRTSRKLHSNQVNRGTIGERWLAEISTESQRVTMWTRVMEVAWTMRRFERYVSASSKTLPSSG